MVCTTPAAIGIYTICLETQSNQSVADPRHPNAVYTCTELSSSTVYQLNCTTTKRGGLPSHCSAIETIDSVLPLCATKGHNDGVAYNWHALTLYQSLDRSSVAAVQLSRFLVSACGATGLVVQFMGTAVMYSSCAFTGVLVLEAICVPFRIMRHVLQVAMVIGWIMVLTSVVLFISWGFEASHLGSFKFAEATYVAFGGVVLSIVALAATHMHANIVYQKHRPTSLSRGSVYVDPKTRLHVLVDTDEATIVLDIDDADNDGVDDDSCLPL
ncbi:hypothetical protein DYB36_000045 [Aphanomyces astaci]|uniref:Transmembrane protein n=1 Tax=Aphanomyces astaci TaxID=112090 RepID=A0A397AX13_APHAT|nr:hypothetical protein DYB36_000045 [Aphanomyces astaci]